MLNKKSTIYKEFEKVALTYKKNAALYYEGKTLYYKDLLLLVKRIGNYFDSVSLKMGDAITLVSPNTPEAVATFFAASMKGLKIHLIHPLATQETIQKEMEEKNSKLLITLSFFLNSYDKIINNGIPLFVLSPTDSLNPLKKVGFALLNKNDLKTFHQHKNFPTMKNAKKINDISVTYPSDYGRVFLSSGGTSGEPKTIVLSDEAILSLISQGLDILSLTEEEALHKSMLAALPMFHGFGLVMGVMTVLYYGAAAALLPKFHTKPIIKLLKQNRVNIMIGVPAMYEALLRNPDFKGDPLKSLDVCFVGGDFISPSLLTRFNQQMKKYNSSALLLEGYGLTETVTVLSVNTMKNHRDGSVGKALKNVEIKIIDEEKNILPPNQIGEILVSGETLMNGYFDGKNCFLKLENKNYVQTGDIGYLDEDGYLYFISRKKRIIKKNGLNIFPLAIEKKVSLLDFVAECAYFSKEKGTRVETYLCVVLKDSSFPLAKEKICEALKEGGYEFEIPDHILFKDSLPKTNVSKIDYKALLDSLKDEM